MTTSESEPPESEIAPPIVLDTRKAKVVALFAAAPGVALLCYWLYVAARRFDLLPGTSPAPGDAGTRIDDPAGWAFASAVFLAILAIPLYFALKIWLRPTLENLRRVPFIAAFWCVIGIPYIHSLLLRFEWIDMAPELPEGSGLLLVYCLMLGVYFLVKNAMVLWFKTPELAQSGLQNFHRETLWWFYCFGLWGGLMTLVVALVEDTEFPFIIDNDIVWMLALIISVVGATYISMYVYKRGLRALGLRTE